MYQNSLRNSKVMAPEVYLNFQLMTRADKPLSLITDVLLILLKIRLKLVATEKSTLRLQEKIRLV